MSQRFDALGLGRIFSLVPPSPLTFRRTITWQANVQEYHRVFDYFAIMSLQFAQKNATEVELGLLYQFNNLFNNCNCSRSRTLSLTLSLLSEPVTHPNFSPSLCKIVGNSAYALLAKLTLIATTTFTPRMMSPTILTLPPRNQNKRLNLGPKLHWSALNMYLSTTCLLSNKMGNTNVQSRHTLWSCLCVFECLLCMILDNCGTDMYHHHHLTNHV